MFVELLTAKNERISVNVSKVLFFAQTKKGTTVILDDGIVLDLLADYESVREQFVDYAGVSFNRRRN